MPQPPDIEAFIHEDADKLRFSFQEAYKETITKLKRPRILVAGVTGVGKSSVINSIFGSDLAAEGAGRPITQHFQKFAPEGQSLVLYDSKGFESGMNYEDVAESTRKYFSLNHTPRVKSKSKHKVNGNSKHRHKREKTPHIVWFVINSAAGRFQDFEERVCRELFGHIPLLFILNKIDIATNDQIQEMTKLLKSLNLSNCIGICYTKTRKFFDTIDIDTCPRCFSPDLIIHKRNKVAVCEECRNTTSLESTKGLDSVLELTLSSLPMIAKEAFVSAQKVSFTMKERRAKRIIRKFYEKQSHVYSTQSLKHLMLQMVTRLSIVWDFKDHGHQYADTISKELITPFSILDRIFFIVHQNTHQVLRATALGIIWNRCVRELAKVVFIESVEGVSTKTIEEEWPIIMKDAFQHLSEESLEALEEVLEEKKLVEILDQEMPRRRRNKRSGHASYPQVQLFASTCIPKLTEGHCWEGFLSGTEIPELAPENQKPVRKKRSKHKLRTKSLTNVATRLSQEHDRPATVK